MYTGALSLANQEFSEQRLDIFLSDVACNGTEANILECKLNSRETFCGPNDDAGAVCQRKSISLKQCMTLLSKIFTPCSSRY